MFKENTTLIDLNHIAEDLGKDNIVFRELNKEVYDSLETLHNRELVRKIYSGRYTDKGDLEKYLNTKLSDIINKEFLSQMTDIGKAARVITRHLEKGNRILYVTDYDVDGITSAVIAHKFTKYVYEHDNFEVLVNKREYGNGINNTITDKIISIYKHQPFDLLITADHGSHDKNNLTRLKNELGVDIIVTDHHLIEDESSPLNVVDAFVNPQRPENNGFLKNITGANVLYFTLLHAWFRLIKRNPELENFVKQFENINTETKWDYIYYLINYVGLTVISDTVDLKCYVNRKLLIKALSTINSKRIKHDTFWTLVKDEISDSYFIDETVLGFGIIPVLNTPGRIDNPRMSYELMTIENIEIAKMLYKDILVLNDTRKNIQHTALKKDNVIKYENDKVCVVLAEDTDGVQGVIANNILFSGKHKLVVCFTKQINNGEEVYIGSGRLKVEEANLKEIVDNIDKKSDLVISHGGHKAAIGIKIKPDLKKFYELLVEEVDKIKEFEKEEQIEIDEYIYSNKKIFTSIYDVRAAGPYGMGYPQPVFVSDVYLHSYRVFNKNGKTYINAKVKLSVLSNFMLNLFYAVPDKEKHLVSDLKTASKLRLVYNISINTYMSTNTVLLNVLKMIVKE
jgi:single-stranded-DNA-specific exonuclease